MISIELKIAPCSAKTMVAPAAWFVPTLSFCAEKRAVQWKGGARSARASPSVEPEAGRDQQTLVARGTDRFATAGFFFWKFL